MIQIESIEEYQENNRIEAKKALGGLPLSIWETYSAFANTLGGVILLGVEEYRDKSFHTVDLPDPQRLVDEFTKILNNKERVSANILADSDIHIETIHGDKIIVIEVPRARRYDKPVFVGDSMYSGTYRRNGEGDYHCTREEIEAMLRDAAVHSADTKVLDTLDISVFDTNTVDRYLDAFHHVRTIDTGNIHTYLQSCVNDHPTMAGLLMFGKYDRIREVIPSYSLVLQDEELEMNLFDFLYYARNRLCEILDTETGSVIEMVITESLANCVINADYHGTVSIDIHIDEDKITMRNPGTFRIPVSKARRGGLADPRNVFIMRMFSLVNIGKNTGSGVPAIYHAWHGEGFDEPQITQSFQPEQTILTLPLTEHNSDAWTTASPEEIASLIISYLTEHHTARRTEIAKYLNLGERQTRKYLNQLVKAQIIITHNKQYGLKA